MTTNGAFRARVRRAVLRGASVVAPGTVEDLLIARFFTPMRRASATDVPRGEHWTIHSGDEEISVFSRGSGPRVLFVHGWEGTAADFNGLADVFNAAGFGTVTFDQPAHGRSTGTRATLPGIARAVLDVARATGPFVGVIGHSLGGSATLLALRDGLPARCAALIAPPYDARPFVEVLGEHMGLSRARVTGAIARIESSVGAVDGRATDRAAAAVRAPGLVLHDRSDRTVPFTHGVRVAAAWPGARFVPLDGLGHRRMLDAPTVQQELLTFVHQSLADVSNGGRTTYAPRTMAVREMTL